MMSKHRILSTAALTAAALVVFAGVAAAQGVVYVKNNRMGIGTDDPTEKPLHIKTDGTVGAGFKVETGPSAPAPKTWYFFQNTVTGAFLISNFPNGAAQFQVFPNVTPSTLVIRDDGIGFGTQSPGVNTFNVAAGKSTIADAWTPRSSLRYKENVQTLSDPLETVAQLRGVSFDWKNTGKPSIGLIAEEVGEVLPELVTYEEGGEDALALDYDKLAALLIEAVKAQQQQIEELQRQLAER